MTETQSPIEELIAERNRVVQAEQALKQELAEIDEKLSTLLDSDDAAVLEAAIARKPLPKSSEYYKLEERRRQLPSQIYALERRSLQLQMNREQE